MNYEKSESQTPKGGVSNVNDIVTVYFIVEIPERSDQLAIPNEAHTDLFDTHYDGHGDVQLSER